MRKHLIHILVSRASQASELRGERLIQTRPNGSTPTQLCCAAYSTCHHHMSPLLHPHPPLSLHRAHPAHRSQLLERPLLCFPCRHRQLSSPPPHRYTQGRLPAHACPLPLGPSPPPPLHLRRLLLSSTPPSSSPHPCSRPHPALGTAPTLIGITALPSRSTPAQPAAPPLRSLLPPYIPLQPFSHFLSHHSRRSCSGTKVAYSAWERGEHAEQPPSALALTLLRVFVLGWCAAMCRARAGASE